MLYFSVLHVGELLSSFNCFTHVSVLYFIYLFKLLHSCICALFFSVLHVSELSCLGKKLYTFKFKIVSLMYLCSVLHVNAILKRAEQ